MNVPQEDVNIPTERGTFAATLYGTPDASAAEPSTFRPVAFLIHGAGMNKEGFAVLARMMVAQCAGEKLANPPPVVVPTEQQEQKAQPAATAGGGPPSAAMAPPTAPPKKTFPKPALGPSLSVGAGAGSLLAGGGGLRQVARGGATPMQSGPGLFDATPGGGGGRATDSQTLDLRLVAFDLRGHGQTEIEGSDGTELSREVFLADCKALIQHCMTEYFSSQRFFYLVGHSLGGSLVAHLAHDAELKPNVGGLVLLDIVEDTAKQSLVHMDDYLDKRPSTFKDPKEAVKWMVQKGGMRNLDAASVTVPTLLRQQKKVASAEKGDEEVASGSASPWTWRTDLRLTKPHWEGWFEQMDDLFVTVPCPKVLVLANTNRLDTKLTTAHMQGKFQFEVIGSHVGHYLMEDDPATVALKLGSFLKRVEALTARLPPSMFRK